MDDRGKTDDRVADAVHLMQIKNSVKGVAVEVAHLRQDLAKYCTEAAKLHEDHEQRIRNLEQSDTANMRLGAIEIQQAKHTERLRNISLGLLALQVVGNAIAAYVGSLR